MKYPPGKVSLERAFSKLGLASRTEARRWIEAGRVTVDGRTIADPGFPVRPEAVRLSVDGKNQSGGGPGSETPTQQRLVVLLHKPRAVVTTRSDEQSRRTIYDCLPPEYQRLIAVGRLDRATTGLLLLTNDTQLGNWLTDPANQIERTYVVTVRGLVSDRALAILRAGVEIEGVRHQIAHLTLRKASGRESHLLVT
ncbi:MAG: pseudouridine synthase, partial [Bdellovibrionota bacterium]